MGLRDMDNALLTHEVRAVIPQWLYLDLFDGDGGYAEYGEGKKPPGHSDAGIGCL